MQQCVLLFSFTKKKKKERKKDRTLQVKASFATQTKPWSHPFSQLDEFHSYVRNIKRLDYQIVLRGEVRREWPRQHISS